VARLLRSVYQAPQVTIAAVHGAAIAGGAGFDVCGATWSLATQDARVAYTEVKRGWWRRW